MDGISKDLIRLNFVPFKLPGKTCTESFKSRVRVMQGFPETSVLLLRCTGQKRRAKSSQRRCWRELLYIQGISLFLKTRKIGVIQCMTGKRRQEVNGYKEGRN